MSGEMDVLLKCFFDHFESMERNALYARYKRRALVEYFNTLIEGYRLGVNCDSETIVRETIVCVLRYHEKSKMNNGDVCMMGKFHNILYVGLKICYDWQLRDTATVAALLDAIFVCEKTFERLFVGAMFGTNASHFIAGWKSDFTDQEENLRALVYFLDHATNANQEFHVEPNSVRFIDAPIECCGRMTCVRIALHMGLPDKLLILLRFGALLNDNDSDCIADALLVRLNDSKRKYPYNLVACLQLILRVLPCIVVSAPTCKNYNIVHNSTRNTILVKFPYLVEDCILPLTRCGFQPAELKHLCRCTIRQRLWFNYQLPNGINALPIPQRLQRYVDIMED